MTRAIAVLYAAAAMSVASGCRRGAERTAQTPPATITQNVTTTVAVPPAPPVDETIAMKPGEISRCEVGSALGNGGFVTETANTIAAGAPLYVSMWLNKTPKELQVSARVLDADGEEVTVVRQEANGAAQVTLKIDQKLKRGAYKVETYWGGNLGCAKSIAVGNVGRITGARDKTK